MHRRSEDGTVELQSQEVQRSTKDDCGIELENEAAEKGGPASTTTITTAYREFLVQFSENDPENPLNWPRIRKWTVTLLVSGAVFLMPLSSAIVAPELATIEHDLNMHNATEATLVLSAFVLTYCLAPLLLGPLSELFGRVVVLHFGNAFYLIFNLVCGFARNKGELVSFRLLSGIGGSASLVVSYECSLVL